MLDYDTYWERTRKYNQHHMMAEYCEGGEEIEEEESDESEMEDNGIVESIILLDLSGATEKLRDQTLEWLSDYVYGIRKAKHIQTITLTIYYNDQKL